MTTTSRRTRGELAELHDSASVPAGQSWPWWLAAATLGLGLAALVSLTLL